MQNYIQSIIDNVYGCGLTYKQKFNKKYGFNKNDSHSLNEISKITKYKKKGLETIYNKGVGAYHTNPKSVRPQVHSPEQWAMARVYASINPSSKASKVDKKHLITGGEINFHKIHWGTFRRQFNNRKNKRLKNFKEFSEYILKNPDKFNKITKKRANFYKNFIFGRGIIGYGPKMTKEEKDKIKKLFPNLEEEERQMYGFMKKYEDIMKNPMEETVEVNDETIPVIQDNNNLEVNLPDIGDINPHQEIDNIIDDLEDILSSDINVIEDYVEKIQDINENDFNLINDKLNTDIEKIRNDVKKYDDAKKEFNDAIQAKSEFQNKMDKEMKKGIRKNERTINILKDSILNAEAGVELAEKEIEKYKNAFNKIEKLEEIQDNLIDKKNISDFKINLINLGLPPQIIEDDSLILKTKDLNISDFEHEPINFDFDNNNINIENTEGMVVLTSLLRNHEIAIDRIKNIFDEYNFPKQDENKYLKEATKAGQSFEYNITGEGNKLSQILYNDENVNLQVNNYLIEEISNELKSEMIKEFEGIYTPEEINALVASQDQFFIDTSNLNPDNPFINECKDNYTRKTIKEMEYEKNNMKKIFSNLNKLLDKETDDKKLILIDNAIQEGINSESFKELYYKNFMKYGQEVQVAKLYPSSRVPYKPTFNENWNFKGVSSTKGKENGNKIEKLNYIYGQRMCEKFNNKFGSNPVQTMITFNNYDNTMILNLSKNKFFHNKNLKNILKEKNGWFTFPYTEMEIITTKNKNIEIPKIEIATKKLKNEYENKNAIRQGFDFQHYADKVAEYNDNLKKAKEKKGRRLTTEERNKVANKTFTKGLEGFETSTKRQNTNLIGYVKNVEKQIKKKITNNEI